MQITNDIYHVGVNDHSIDLFEGLYPAPNGMAYNSYVIMDEKIAVMDAVDAHFGQVWLENLRQVLGGRTPDFLVVHHMEPDHSASMTLFMDTYPEALIVASAKAFPMMQNFFHTDYAARRIIVKEGDMLCLGRHTLRFLAAPMVHWPEVIMSVDTTAHVLFSADAFGKFGTLDYQEPWTDEARRYYFGIVGKYGTQVQALLKKVATQDVRLICPLHGPVLQGNALAEALRLYDIWSSYQAESSGVMIAHASVYGNTRAAAEQLAASLRADGLEVAVHDLTRCDMTAALADAFRYDRLVLAAATYNADVFPPMRTLLNWMKERGYHKRTVGLIENGSWAPMAAKVMRSTLESCQDVTILAPVVSIRSALNEESSAQLEALKDALV